jgi:hypothetical protein
MCNCTTTVYSCDHKYLKVHSCPYNNEYICSPPHLKMTRVREYYECKMCMDAMDMRSGATEEEMEEERKIGEEAERKRGEEQDGGEDKEHEMEDIEPWGKERLQMGAQPEYDGLDRKISDVETEIVELENRLKEKLTAFHDENEEVDRKAAADALVALGSGMEVDPKVDDGR